MALALALGPKSLALALIPQGLGLGLDLVTCVLGLGLGSQVLVNITAGHTAKIKLKKPAELKYHSAECVDDQCWFLFASVELMGVGLLC